MRVKSFGMPLPIAALLAAIIWSSLAFAPAPPANVPTRRSVPVTNLVPKGAQPINGTVLKVEVIEAVDINRTSWQLKIALRLNSPRDERVRCSLTTMFDGKPMAGAFEVDIPKDQTDITVVSGHIGDGKGASQLSKLTAEASNIRIGE
jgi:hypothetical protein